MLKVRRVEVCELTGKALSYAVAIAKGIPAEEIYIPAKWQKEAIYIPAKWQKEAIFRMLRDEDGNLTGRSLAPDLLFASKWEAGGPIIDSEIHTLIQRDGVWQAECFYPKYPDPNRFCYSLKGPTALTAAMRTFVASRLGAEIDIPEELKGTP